MTRARLDAITHKAATVGGITDDERSEWHRLLCTAANSPQSDPIFRGMFTGEDYARAGVYLDATAYRHAKPQPTDIEAQFNSYLGNRGE